MDYDAEWEHALKEEMIPETKLLDEKATAVYTVVLATSRDAVNKLLFLFKLMDPEDENVTTSVLAGIRLAAAHLVKVSELAVAEISQRMLDEGPDDSDTIPRIEDDGDDAR